LFNEAGVVIKDNNKEKRKNTVLVLFVTLFKIDEDYIWWEEQSPQTAKLVIYIGIVEKDNIIMNKRNKDQIIKLIDFINKNKN
jgi:hypothetical protein